jgi:branched-chain amino acid transport system ATP-binding protein
MLLEVRDLWVHYEKAEALKGVSMNVGEKMLVTLIGANGAGKTSILRTISGLKVLTSGEIWFQGKRIDKIPPHDIVRLGIAHIPEGRRLFPTMTVLDNLMLGAYSRKDKHEIFRERETMYEHFPILRKRSDQTAGSLSGGEQQMLTTARALMSGPKLLLMDEPSLGLSPLLVYLVGKIAKDIIQSGVSIILVEQNARLALQIADRAYVVERGRIVLEGDAKEIANDGRVKKAYLSE